MEVLGITRRPINCLEEALEAYRTGVAQRHTATTAMNDASSRSHLVFTLVVHSTSTETRQQSYSKISFVDLAGSEKVNKAKPSIH